MRQKLGGWENGLSEKTINNFRQNTPELILEDAERMLDLKPEEIEVLRSILLARGVNKWFKARRDIIRLKNDLRYMIKEVHTYYDKTNKEHKERLKMLNFFMSVIRKICHQQRWVEWPKIRSAKRAEKKVIVKGPFS